MWLVSVSGFVGFLHNFCFHGSWVAVFGIVGVESAPVTTWEGITSESGESIPMSPFDS